MSENEELSISELYGLLGEHYVELHLKEKMDTYCRADVVDHIGQHLLKEGCCRDFDVPNCSELADGCRKVNYCEIPSDSRPCLSSEFYHPNYNPEPCFGLDDRKDNKFNSTCALRLTNIAMILYEKGKLPSSYKFIMDYLICHHYIVNIHSDDNKDYNNFSELDWKNYFKYYKGHPGRLDYFARSGSKLYCIESKVNSSKPTLWQLIRMSWMRRCGYSSFICHVKFIVNDKSELREIFSSSGIHAAVQFLNPSLDIIEYDPHKYREVEAYTENRNIIISAARKRLIGYGGRVFDRSPEECL